MRCLRSHTHNYKNVDTLKPSPRSLCGSVFLSSSPGLSLSLTDRPHSLYLTKKKEPLHYSIIYCQGAVQPKGKPKTVCLYLSMCLSVSLCVSLSLPLSMCVCITLSYTDGKETSFTLLIHLFIQTRTREKRKPKKQVCVPLPVSVCVSMCLCLSLCLHVTVNASLCVSIATLHQHLSLSPLHSLPPPHLVPPPHSLSFPASHSLHIPTKNQKCFRTQYIHISFHAVDCVIIIIDFYFWWRCRHAGKDRCGEPAETT
jgi:hypothetical protein